ncbi:dTDP-4-dehydrorhamnose reductase [Microbulbifer epialgicus]|uniref:dTDP-4-dehydrorhamnose reductase n=1 Tax=Microbulbifer epialgicus TaxID=393907 RepID=A0ABV4P6S1_9GAMM
MKVLVTGSNGQLGRELQFDCPKDLKLIPLSRQVLDISDKAAVFRAVKKIQPNVIINAAAYTSVDNAEDEHELTFTTNTRGPEILALACKQFDIRLLQISTDYVFDGNKSSPYLISDSVNPINIYGLSKAKAEKIIQKILPNAVILRTASLYANHSKNFVNTMLGMMSKNDQLSIVVDQVGTPTWIETLTKAVFSLVRNESLQGIYHCTDLGVASWYDFAVAIYDEAQLSGLLPDNEKVAINAIASKDYPTPAQRPAYSVLDKSRLQTDLNINLKSWRESLKLAFSKRRERLLDT